MNTAIVVPNFKLLLNGTAFSPEMMNAVEGVMVEDEINLPAMFTVKFNIIDFENGSWRGIDLKAFKPGDEIKVLMGIDDLTEIMTGEITSLDLTLGDFSSMEIKGYDRLHRLRFGTWRRSFKDMKDSEIASSIASEAGLSPQVKDTKTVHPYIFQNNQTNYGFLSERMKNIGYEMLVEDKTFMFRPSQENKAAELTLEYGVDFNSLSLQLKTLTEGSKIEIRGWDVKNKKEIVSTASSGSEITTMGGKDSGYKLSENAFGGSATACLDKAIIDAAEAEAIANAQYNSMLQGFIAGEGKCIGNPLIRAGKTIEIKGIGDRFSGIYYLTSTVHSIDEQQGYITTFKVRRSGV